MSRFDKELATAVRHGAGTATPSPRFAERILARIDRRERQTRLRRAVGGAVAAVVMLGLALPGPRTLAMDLAEHVYKMYAVTYRFVEPPLREPDPYSEPREAFMVYAPAIDTEYKAVGEFPTEARAAIQEQDARYRLPDWVPPDVPVTVAVPVPLTPDPAAAAAGVPLPQLPLVFRFGNPDDRTQQIIVEQQLLPDGDHTRMYVHDPGEDGIITKLTIGNTDVLETRIADRVLYTFNLDGVQIDVAGPLAQLDTIYKLTEALQEPKRDGSTDH